MAKTLSGPQIATANRLDDGRVVFLAADGGWSEDIAAARIAHEPGETAALEREAAAAAAANLVVEPYLVAVEAGNGSGLTPVEMRERMRLAGPTTGNAVRAGARKENNGSATVSPHV